MSILTENVKTGKEMPEEYFKVNDEDLEYEIERIECIQTTYQLNYNQVLETLKLLENRRKNNLLTKIYDVFDDRMEYMIDAFNGISRHLHGIEYSLDNISDGIREAAKGLEMISDTEFFKQQEE